MRTRSVVVVLLLLAGWVMVGLADCELKSRGFAGFAFRDLSGADRDSLGNRDLAGIVVTVVVPGSPDNRGYSPPVCL